MKFGGGGGWGGEGGDCVGVLMRVFWVGLGYLMACIRWGKGIIDVWDCYYF